jgi:hypothetical protein
MFRDRLRASLSSPTLNLKQPLDQLSAVLYEPSAMFLSKRSARLISAPVLFARS